MESEQPKKKKNKLKLAAAIGATLLGGGLAYKYGKPFIQEQIPKVKAAYQNTKEKVEYELMKEKAKSDLKSGINDLGFQAYKKLKQLSGTK